MSTTTTERAGQHASRVEVWFDAIEHHDSGFALALLWAIPVLAVLLGVLLG